MIYEQEILDAINALVNKLDAKTLNEVEIELQNLNLLVDLRTQTLRGLIDDLNRYQRQLSIMADAMDDDDE